MLEDKPDFNPWLSICTKPRRTIRLLVNYNVNYRFIAMCAILGSLLAAFPFSLPPFSFYFFMVLLVFPSYIVLGIIATYLLYHLFSASVFFCGKLIKGAGTFKKIRAAIYWTSVPTIGSLIISTAIVFIHARGQHPLFPQDFFFLKYTLPFAIFFVIWVFIIRVQAIGEVQKFSAWMALLNLLLSFVPFLVLGYLSLLIVSFARQQEISELILHLYKKLLLNFRLIY